MSPQAIEDALADATRFPGHRDGILDHGLVRFAELFVLAVIEEPLDARLRYPGHLELRGVVAELGWIDRERFGRVAANDAFLIVQHSGDLPLMLAVLPHIEAAVRERQASAQDFALLYDRTRMRLGHRQRYGTQLVGKLDGKLWLFPLEDPERVEERRTEIGLFPLATYLSLLERETGRTVRR